MSSTAEKIRHFIESLVADAIFTSSQVLHLGSRNAVDLVLSRLVKKKFLRRLAAGVFVVQVPELRVPEALEIAKAKASAFGKRILTDNRLPENTFSTDGCYSSFNSVHGRLYFKSLAPSKIDGDGRVKKILIATANKALLSFVHLSKLAVQGSVEITEFDPLWTCFPVNSS